MSRRQTFKLYHEILLAAKTPAKPTALRLDTGISGHSYLPIIEQLVDAELLEKVEVSGDKRSTHAYQTTDKGRKFTEHVGAAFLLLEGPD